MTEYNYLDGKKTVLTADGKTPHIRIVRGLNEEIINILGAAGRLKGEALEDYQKRKGKNNNAGRT